MGLFGFLRYNDVEKSLLALYTQAFIGLGLSPTEAKRAVYSLLDRAIKESKRDGTYYLPPDMGEMILGDVEPRTTTEAKVADYVRQQLQQKRDDGVKDEDIKWWWNLNEIERRIMLKFDDISKFYVYVRERQPDRSYNVRGTVEQAAAATRRSHPLYGDPEDTTIASGDDRPLPIELKDRVNKYVHRKSQHGLEAIRESIEESSSFNALVRKEIREGNL